MRLPLRLLALHATTSERHRERESRSANNMLARRLMIPLVRVLVRTRAKHQDIRHATGHLLG